MAPKSRRRSELDRGEWVFVEDAAEAWVLGKVEARSAGDVTVLVGGERKVIKLRKDGGNVADSGTSLNEDIENLVDLDSFTEGSILHHVRKRFQGDLIYTLVGSILVAVNPFKRLPIYTPELMDSYRARASGGDPPPPDVFLTAGRCYDAMVDTKQSQSVLISGESGAGKTETTKFVLAFVARVAGRGGRAGAGKSVEEQILQSNPVLEAYGNAKTLRNNNSSRFGTWRRKWMKIEFEGNSKIRGCSITNYLLEKSRVVWQSKGERSYHAFYQLFKGAKEREAYGIGADPEAFATLTKGGCTTVDAIDDAQEWDDQRAALDILDFSKDDQRVALGVVAATLHLGLAAFSADGDGSRVSDAACLAKAAPLLGVDAGKLAAALTTRTEQMGRGSMVTIKLSPPAAKDAADALAKALYGRLFDWLVVKINASISRGEGACHVGVLDIFGFEVFKVNSFEQLCINYTNEKLQLFFNDVVFGEEMKMYESEGVPHTHMAFEDNASPPPRRPRRPRRPAAARKKKKGAKTLGAAFRAQLHGLMDALKATQPHSVRCVKSNPGKKRRPAAATMFERFGLKYSGLFEAIKIRKAGYAYRVPHAVFAKRYALTAPRGGFDLVRKHGKNLPADVALTCCENILNDPANLAALLAADGAKDAAAVMAVGKTRVFLKDALAQKALETRRARAMESFVVLCQAAWRSFAARSKAGGGLAESRRKAKRDALRKQRAKAAGDLVTRWIRGARVRRSLAGARKPAGLSAAAKRTAAPRSTTTALRDLGDALRPFLEAQTGPDGAPRADLGKCFAGPPKAGEPSAHLLAHLPAPVAREVAAAAAALYRLREGGKLLHAIADARASHDVKKLRRLLKRADDLDLGDCEAVASARAEFEDIVKRAELVESLRRFVADPFGAQAPSGADLDVPKLLEEAARLGLASPEVDEARRRYDEVEPTLDARRELRHAVEGVHADGIDESLKRVLALLDDCDPRPRPHRRRARRARRGLGALEGAFDAARGPRSPRPDALSARAPLDAGPSRRAPDYPGISRQEASDLAKSRANLKKSRAALQRTNKKLHIVTGVHAAPPQAWHPARRRRRDAREWSGGVARSRRDANP
ncbi:hypothetical protein JL720_8662 [Aureococcus anophagefferens]|nr:hypothetical protein JL720_8662 [Aureococcus anophagefferens]